jgi:hypothetical protein
MVDASDLSARAVQTGAKQETRQMLIIRLGLFIIASPSPERVADAVN